MSEPLAPSPIIFPPSPEGPVSEPAMRLSEEERRRLGGVALPLSGKRHRRDEMSRLADSLAESAIADIEAGNLTAAAAKVNTTLPEIAEHHVPYRRLSAHRAAKRSKDPASAASEAPNARTRGRAFLAAAAEEAQADAVDRILAHPESGYAKEVWKRVRPSEFYDPERDYSRELNPHNVEYLRQLLIAKYINPNRNPDTKNKRGEQVASYSIRQQLRSGSILTLQDPEIADYLGIGIHTWRAQKEGQAIYVDPVVVDKINFMLRLDDKHFAALLERTPRPTDYVLQQRMALAAELRRDTPSAERDNRHDAEKWDVVYEAEHIDQWDWEAAIRHIAGVYRQNIYDDQGNLVYEFQDVPLQAVSDLSIATMLVSKSGLVQRNLAEHPGLTEAQAHQLGLSQVWANAIAICKHMQERGILADTREDASGPTRIGGPVGPGAPVGFAVLASQAELERLVESYPLGPDDAIRTAHSLERVAALHDTIEAAVDTRVQEWQQAEADAGRDPSAMPPDDLVQDFREAAQTSIIEYRFGDDARIASMVGGALDRHRIRLTYPDAFDNDLMADLITDINAAPQPGSLGTALDTINAVRAERGDRPLSFERMEPADWESAYRDLRGHYTQHYLSSFFDDPVDPAIVDTLWTTLDDQIRRRPIQSRDMTRIISDELDRLREAARARSRR